MAWWALGALGLIEAGDGNAPRAASSRTLLPPRQVGFPVPVRSRPALAVLVCLAAILAACGRAGDGAHDSAGCIAPGTEANAERAILVRCVEINCRRIALTFDVTLDTDSRALGDVLSALAAAGAPATFSVTGLWAEQHPGLLNAITAAGHQLINGGYHGVSFTGASTGSAPLTPGEITSELSRTETTVFRMTSRSTRPFFRPPHGDYDDGTLGAASGAGYNQAILWSIDTTSAHDIAARLRDVPHGAIIRIPLHAGTASALRSVIDTLREQRYGLERLSDLLATE